MAESADSMAHMIERPPMVRYAPNNGATHHERGQGGVLADTVPSTASLVRTASSSAEPRFSGMLPAMEADEPLYPNRV